MARSKINTRVGTKIVDGRKRRASPSGRAFTGLGLVLKTGDPMEGELGELCTACGASEYIPGI